MKTWPKELFNHKLWKYELKWSTWTQHQHREPACGRMRRRTASLSERIETSAAENQCSLEETGRALIMVAQTWPFHPNTDPWSANEPEQVHVPQGCKEREIWQAKQSVYRFLTSIILFPCRINQIKKNTKQNEVIIRGRNAEHLTKTILFFIKEIDCNASTL